MAGNEQGPFPTIVLDDIVEYVRDLLSKGYRKGEIKDKLREELGTDGAEPSTRSMETLISAARAQMLEDSDRPREEHQADAIEFYKSVLRDPKAKTSSKIAARARIDSILGLGAQHSTLDDPEDKAAKARQFLKETEPE